VLPQGFNGIVWCPDSGDAGMIGLQLGACDGAIVFAKMCDYCCHGDIGKAKPNVSLLSSAKYKQLMAVKSCFFISSWTVMEMLSSLMVAS